MPRRSRRMPRGRSRFIIPNFSKHRVTWKSDRLTINFGTGTDDWTNSYFVSGNDFVDPFKHSTIQQPTTPFTKEFAAFYQRAYVPYARVKFEVWPQDNNAQTLVYHWITIVGTTGQAFPATTTHTGLLRSFDPKLRGPTRVHPISTGINLRNISYNQGSTRYALGVPLPMHDPAVQAIATWVDPTTTTPGYWQWSRPNMPWYFQCGVTRNSFTVAPTAFALTCQITVTYDVLFMYRHEANNIKLTAAPLIDTYVEEDERDLYQYEHTDANVTEFTGAILDVDHRPVVTTWAPAP